MMSVGRSTSGRSRGGGGRKTDEEKFADRLRLLRAEGEAAFFNDSDKAVIEELKKLKSQPGLAEAAVRDVKAGRGLQGDALEIRDALERKKAGQEFNAVIEKYGTGAQLADKFAERQRLLNIMVKDGGLSADQAALAFADYLSKFQNFQWIDKLADSVTSLTETLVLEPEKWKESLQNFLKDITRMVIQETISNPIKNGIRSLLGSFIGGGSDSGLGGLFGGLLKGLFGGFGGGGNFGAGASIGAMKMHSGGTVGIDGQAILQPAGSFDGAPRFHDGLRSDEMRAVLQKGEDVLTGRDKQRVAGLVGSLSTAAMSGGARSGDVNIHNYGPTEPEVRRRDDGSIDLIIRAVEDRMAGNLLHGQGSLGSAFKARQTGGHYRG